MRLNQHASHKQHINNVSSLSPQAAAFIHLVCVRPSFNSFKTQCILSLYNTLSKQWPLFYARKKGTRGQEEDKSQRKRIRFLWRHVSLGCVLLLFCRRRVYFFQKKREKGRDCERKLSNTQTISRICAEIASGSVLHHTCCVYPQSNINTWQMSPFFYLFKPTSKYLIQYKLLFCLCGLL